MKTYDICRRNLGCACPRKGCKGAKEVVYSGVNRRKPCISPPSTGRSGGVGFVWGMKPPSRYPLGAGGEGALCRPEPQTLSSRLRLAAAVGIQCDRRSARVRVVAMPCCDHGYYRKVRFVSSCARVEFVSGR